VSSETDLTSMFLASDCPGAFEDKSCFYFLPFEATEKLRKAVDDYLSDESPGTLVSRTYGWPIGVWDVSKIQDFSLPLCSG
jgi:hypothetical protein